MRVIGTAGHVDHGKSTLVRRLTGIDPDRLAEEKRRALTIDLGFAWFDLPDGETVGVVDVPGHRDFIENMLAGVGGIDAVLLVIAADEGVMPQTREHLAILDLLDVHNGLIVLTKTDVIDDAEWLPLVEDEIRGLLGGTALADAPLLPVSAHTGSGIDDLFAALTTLLADLPPQPDYNTPRLSVDRVFTMSGFGTVVTGTLLGGKLRVGDEVELQPRGRRARVRGLQSYQQSVSIAYPGSRVAVNLTGIDREQVTRGDTLTHPGHLSAAQLVDVYFRHLPDSSRPLKHNTEVKVFVGAAETTAHVRLLDADALQPGETGWLQLRLANPLAVAQSDRFILRYPSPPETIGGGVVVNPTPARRWKRFQPTIIADLETRMQGSPAQRVAQAATSIEPLKRPNLQKLVGYSDAELDSAITAALDAGLLVQLPDSTYLSTVSFQHMLTGMVATLTAFHQAEPLRVGMSREELRGKIGVKGKTLDLLLAMQTDIAASGSYLHMTDHVVQFTAAQEAAIAKLFAALDAAPYTPPAYDDLAAITGEAVLRALIERGELVQVQPDIVFSRAAYDEMVAVSLAMIDSDGELNTASFRDHFGTSRKYAIGLLEHLDSIGVTRRVGDVRVRKAAVT